MIGATLTVFRKVRHQGREFSPGEYVVGEETEGRVLSEDDAKIVLTYPTWAKLSADADVEFDLTADDEIIKAMLEPMTEAMRNDLWTTVDPEAMATFLVERVGKERKAWQVQTMGNMIEKHFDL